MSRYAASEKRVHPRFLETALEDAPAPLNHTEGALNGHTSTIKISGFVYFLIGLLFGTALSLWRGVELPAFH